MITYVKMNKKQLKNAFKHLKTVHIHRKLVCENCFKCGLYAQGLVHDLSKYSPIELLSGMKYYQGDRSPLDLDQQINGYSKAWLHHQGRNKHHWEYWYAHLNHQFVPIEMPTRYLVESICDRIAASKIYLKDKYTDASPYEYLTRNNDRNYMHPNTAKEFERILLYLKENGEEKTFEMLKKMVKENK